MSAPPPLLSARARALIDRLAAGSYQFIPAPKFWEAVKGKELDNSDHAFVNITRCIDGWDKSKSEINKMICKDGTVWYALGCPEVLNEQAVKDAHLWRDSVTNTVLCSETFKEEATSMGLTNLRFIELRNA